MRNYDTISFLFATIDHLDLACLFLQEYIEVMANLVQLQGNEAVSGHSDSMGLHIVEQYKTANKNGHS